MRLDDPLTLLAVDGDITTDVRGQLSQLPNNCTDIFISVGGNDALQNAYLLNESTSTVGDAFKIFYEAIKEFKQNYLDMITNVIQTSAEIDCKNITIVTIYKDIPDLGIAEQTALSLFNEIILEIAFKLKLSVIDLRNICTDESDYSSISPIEPSRKGGEKITDTITSVLTDDNQDKNIVSVYLSPKYPV